MKKKILAVGTSAFLISAIMLTFATSKVQAQDESLPGWQLLSGTCKSDPTKTITVCGAGSDASCTPDGTCP